MKFRAKFTGGRRFSACQDTIDVKRFQISRLRDLREDRCRAGVVQRHQTNCSPIAVSREQQASSASGFLQGESIPGDVPREACEADLSASGEPDRCFRAAPHGEQLR
jgi:hypothetical protein